MNKIICDVCGTDYPETAAQCPICGCAGAGTQTSAGTETADAEEKAAYVPVKGGRYSKANVRKRLKANQAAYDPIPDSDPDPEYEDDEELEEAEEEDRGSNRGLVIVVVILLLAIVAVSAYIAISIFGLGFDQFPISINKPGVTQTTPTKTPTEAPTTEPTVPAATGVPCVELAVSDVQIHLKTVGTTWPLTVTPVPSDTTEQMVFASDNTNVVTVDENGLVTAVGTGEASITVTCGEVVVVVPVVCELENTETTAPTEPPEDFVLKLLSKDFTLKQAGATYKLYDGEMDPAQITWTTDDEAVATIEKGIVTAVGNGRTRVYGQYGDQKVSCWVSCRLPEVEVTEPTDPNTETTAPTEPAGTYAIRINRRKPNYGTETAAEATLYVGDGLDIRVVDEEGQRVDVQWVESRKNIVTLEGTTVTGAKAGKVVLTAEIDGQKLSCTLFVRENP